MAASSVRKVAVLGAGAWGTVFAQILADAGNQVRIWARRAELAEQINAGENPRYVPGIKLHGISAASDLEWVCQGAGMVVVSIPSNGVRALLEQVRDFIPLNATVISLVKGLEAGTLQMMTEVISEAGGIHPSRIVAVSGPNLSGEIARHEPTGAAVAGQDSWRAGLVASRIHTHYFRPYVAEDVVGVEIGGVVKNIIAMAVGAADGLGLGVNSRSFLITRGLAEMVRLGVAMGGKSDTFLGLAGLGDLVATCSSSSSRNFAFGYRLGQGMDISQALQASEGTVEGARSCPVVRDLAHKKGVSMPINSAAYRVISGKQTLEEALVSLSTGPRVTDGPSARMV